MSKEIKLADGTHTLNPPTAKTFLTLAALGYDIWGDERPSIFSLDLLVPAVPKKDPAPKKAAKDDAGAIDPRRPDLAAVRDHVYALLLESEPDAGWTPDKVIVPLYSINEVTSALLDLDVEGWTEPTGPLGASVETSPSEQASSGEPSESPTSN